MSLLKYSMSEVNMSSDVITTYLVNLIVYKQSKHCNTCYS